MTDFPLRTTFSDDRRHRYLLVRDLGSMMSTGPPRTITFCMLNPSTADEGRDDPTIRRCIGFATRWGYERLLIVNLSPYRATDPKDLFANADFGDDHHVKINPFYVGSAAGQSETFVAAWGAHGPRVEPSKLVLDSLLAFDHPMRCLGLTAEGHPRHPLYVPNDTKLEEFRAVR